MQIPSQFRKVPAIALLGKLGGEKSRVGILTSGTQPGPHISHWHQHHFASMFGTMQIYASAGDCFSQVDKALAIPLAFDIANATHRESAMR
jgi:hypothetical protein